MAEHYGYLPVVHRRKICLSDVKCVITDEVLGEGEHTIGINWHLLLGDWFLNGRRATFKNPNCRLSVSVESKNCPIEPKLIETFESLLYGSKEKIKCLNCETMVKLPAIFTTTVTWTKVAEEK